MRHTRPDLQGRAHVSRGCNPGQADGVVQQDLGRPDLDQQRRQAPQVGMDRTGQRLPRRAAAEIEGGHVDQARLVQRRIGLGLGDDGLADALQVDPWRNGQGRSRHGQALVPGLHQHGHRQSTAGRVSRDHDRVRLVALGQQPAIGRDRIVHRRRETMFGSQPIVDRQPARPGRPRQPAPDPSVALRVADHERPAVQVEQGPLRVGARTVRPHRRHAAGRRLAERQPVGRRKIGQHRVELFARHGGGRGEIRACAPTHDLDDGGKLFLAHQTILSARPLKAPSGRARQ